jgi:hypothetical protein
MEEVPVCESGCDGPAIDALLSPSAPPITGCFAALMRRSMRGRGALSLREILHRYHFDPRRDGSEVQWDPNRMNSSDLYAVAALSMPNFIWKSKMLSVLEVLDADHEASQSCNLETARPTSTACSVAYLLTRTFVTRRRIRISRRWTFGSGYATSTTSHRTFIDKEKGPCLRGRRATCSLIARRAFGRSCG